VAFRGFVVVSGPPAAGKSSLAPRLARYILQRPVAFNAFDRTLRFIASRPRRAIARTKSGLSHRLHETWKTFVARSPIDGRFCGSTGALQS